MLLVVGREDEAEGPGGRVTKTIVFATFTKGLDLMEQRLQDTSIGWLRLDGSMRLQARTEAIRSFARDPKVPCPSPCCCPPLPS